LASCAGGCWYDLLFAQSYQGPPGRVAIEQASALTVRNHPQWASVWQCLLSDCKLQLAILHLVSVHCHKGRCCPVASLKLWLTIAPHTFTLQKRRDHGACTSSTVISASTACTSTVACTPAEILSHSSVRTCPDAHEGGASCPQIRMFCAVSFT
jgi:hypothetical protein